MAEEKTEVSTPSAEPKVVAKVAAPEAKVYGKNSEKATRGTLDKR